MNNLKLNPIGIDKAIEGLQIALYKELSTLGGSITGFGRVYKNKIDSGYALETHNVNSDYHTNVLDGEKSRFFFYLESMEGDDDLKAKVDIVFMVNLKELFNDVARNDEEFRAVVTKVIKRSRFNQLRPIIGMDHIKGLISDGYKDTNLDYNDFHPYHAVTFQTEINYKLKTC